MADGGLVPCPHLNKSWSVSTWEDWSKDDGEYTKTEITWCEDCNEILERRVTNLREVEKMQSGGSTV